MDEFGSKLRKCAQEIGLTDIEVARRLGISQQRFGNYVSGRHRPDFDMLMRICRVLGTHPDRLLGWQEASEEPETEEAVLRRRIGAVASTMDSSVLRCAVAMMDALAELNHHGDR